jgi:hypothetical protein
MFRLERKVGENLGNIRQGKQLLGLFGKVQLVFLPGAGGEGKGAQQPGKQLIRFHFANSLVLPAK